MQLQERFAWAGLMLVLVSAVVMTWASFDLRPPDRPYQRSVTDKAGQNHQPGVAPAVPDRSGANREKPAEPDWANPNCENPSNHDEADLCEQRRMSRSADDTYRLNRLQVFLGVVGAGLVIAGLYYARQAALAAMAAAKHAGEQATAAFKQTRVAEDALMKVQRPYVFTYGVDRIIAHQVRGAGGNVGFTIANYGQTPAIIESIDTDISVGVIPEEMIPFEYNPWVHNPLLKPDEHREMIYPFPPGLDAGSRNVHLDERGSFINRLHVSEGSFAFFRVVISYRGPLTKGHQTAACWVFSEDEVSFVPYGGDEYNYTR